MAILLDVRQEIPSVAFLPLQEAAEWYGVAQSTLYQMLSKGQLTRHKRDGDKRTYLKVTELEGRLRPRPT